MAIPAVRQRVLAVGCGVGTTAIGIARDYGAQVTAGDIAPLMRAHARANVHAAAVTDRVAIEHGDILTLAFADNQFDRVLAEAVTMFVIVRLLSLAVHGAPMARRCSTLPDNHR